MARRCLKETQAVKRGKRITSRNVGAGYGELDYATRNVVNRPQVKRMFLFTQDGCAGLAVPSNSRTVTHPNVGLVSLSDRHRITCLLGMDTHPLDSTENLFLALIPIVSGGTPDHPW